MRWRKDDQGGAPSFITDQKRPDAACLVVSGEAISLAMPLGTISSADNTNTVKQLLVQLDWMRVKQRFPTPYLALTLNFRTSRMKRFIFDCSSDSLEDLPGDQATEWRLISDIPTGQAVSEECADVLGSIWAIFATSNTREAI